VTNHLAGEASPYLLQHVDNPVDWWPWGEEAFAEARRRDVPVLLSVGYSACHWCHVMAHESFEDPDVAALVNRLFVPIKVDREERPDVDAVYMEVTQAMTGSGGWPMTVFTTPDAEPFYAGTYFPPQPGRGMPSFTQLCTALGEMWAEDRERVLAGAADVVRRLARDPLHPPGRPLTPELLETAVDVLRRDADPVNGGTRGAPKFPPAMVIEAQLRIAATPGPAAAQALADASLTLERMARGGIYDQLGGGFARYSVDAAWVVPHFEKMLYDNALLARAYGTHHRLTGSPLSERVGRETLDFLLAELRTVEGGFASSLDADSADASGHLEEGAFYVWRAADLTPELARLLGVTAAGTFEGDTSVLQLPRDPDDPDAWASARQELLRRRASRTRPARDDKVVAAWNGLAIAALADAGARYDEPRWLDAARAAAELLLRVHLVDGRLRRVSRDGVVGRHAGVLEDHADVAEGLLALHQATGERRWLEEAGRLLEVVLERFADRAPGREGALFDTADDAPALVSRPAELADNATPSGASAAAGALLGYAALTASTRHREAALAVLEQLTPLIAAAPRFAGWATAVTAAALAGPLEVAVVGRPDLLAVARAGTSPGAVVVAGPGDAPLVALRPEGAAYVCRGSVCDAPTTEPVRLREQIGGRLPSATV